MPKIDAASVAEHRAAKKRALFPRWTGRVTGAMADAPTKADRILALDEQADRMHRQQQEPLITTVVHAGTRMLESGQSIQQVHAHLHSSLDPSVAAHR